MSLLQCRRLLYQRLFLAFGPHPWLRVRFPMLENVFRRNLVALLRLALWRRRWIVHLPPEPRLVLEVSSRAGIGSEASYRVSGPLLFTLVGAGLGIAGRPTGLSMLAVVCIVAAILTALAQQTLP